MRETYTFTARSASDPSRVVTLTLHDHRLSVGTGPPLEQVQRAVREQEGEEGDEALAERRPWLRPLALSLIQEGTAPFPVKDVSAQSDQDWLTIRAWYRAGGLRLLPVTLIDGQVDNPDAAEGFVRELQERKAEVSLRIGLFELLDYWATWALAFVSIAAMLLLWRRQRDRS